MAETIKSKLGDTTPEDFNDDIDIWVACPKCGEQLRISGLVKVGVNEAVANPEDHS